MKKQLFFRIIALVVLNIMVISLGMTSFAAVRPHEGIQWSYLVSCSYLFDKDQELTNYDIFACGGATVVPSGYYAYVKVTLQYLDGNTWRTFDSWEDQGYISAGVEEYIRVTPGYTYRLKTVHKAINSNGIVLETFNDEADYYIASRTRT